MARLLDVRNLSVAYGKVEAIRRISLVVEEGSIVTVIGPNGAGKTTLLQAIMGLLPAQGEIVYAGTAIQRMTVEQRVGAGLVLVPEKRELFGSMKVADNLELGAFARLRRGERDALRSLAEVYERFPRLRERCLQEAGTLSGGERQMLALGRALMAKPRLLMLDEPSLGLAPIVIDQIYDVVAELAAAGQSILVVEENAARVADKAALIALLDNGELVWSGAGAELMARPEILETYLGA